MKHLLAMVSITLVFLASCKSRESKESGGGAQSPINEQSGVVGGEQDPCALNLAAAIPPPPPNVPEDRMDRLGLEFSVQANNQVGTTNYIMSVEAQPIRPWSGMPKELEDRVADFVRVSVCNISGNCIAMNSDGTYRAERGAEFDFASWVGEVVPPEEITGTLFFKARACTYVRELDQRSGLMVPSGSVRCSNRQVRSEPAQLVRSVPGSDKRPFMIGKLKNRIEQTGNKLLPTARMYLASLQGEEARTKEDQTLEGIAKLVVSDPQMVGAYLTSPVKDIVEYAMVQDLNEQRSTGLGLSGNASADPCLSQIPEPAPVNSLPPAVNEQGQVEPQVVEVIKEVEKVVYVEVPSEPVEIVVEKTIVETVEVLPGVFKTVVPYSNQKVRVFDKESGELLGCMIRPNNISVILDECTDEANAKWDMLPVKTLQASFQITWGDRTTCLFQSEVGVGLKPCSEADFRQYFRWQRVPATEEAPTHLYNATELRAFEEVEGEVPDDADVICIDQTEGFFVAKNTTVSEEGAESEEGMQTCSLMFTFDQLEEEQSSLDNIAEAMGTDSDSLTKYGVGSAIAAGGFLIGNLSVLAYFGGIPLDIKRSTKNKKVLRELLASVEVKGDKITNKGKEKLKKGGFENIKTLKQFNELKTQLGNVGIKPKTEGSSKLKNLRQKTAIGVGIGGVVASAVLSSLVFTDVLNVSGEDKKLGLSTSPRQDFIRALQEAGKQYETLNRQMSQLYDN